MVESGVNMVDIKKAMGWKVSTIAGALVSHEHKDHAGHIIDVMKCGIPVLALAEVFSSQGQQGSPFAREIQPMKGYRVGAFRVFAFPLAHDVPCLGFVIEHEEMGKTLFITDTMMCEYRFAGLSHIMIEANYSDAILGENIDNGSVPPSLRDRLMHSHMELRTAADYIRGCDLGSVIDIVLLHLSGNNSDMPHFRATIEAVSAKPVYVAAKGLTINFSKEPY